MKPLALFLACVLAFAAELLATSESVNEHVFAGNLAPGEVLLVRTSRWTDEVLTLQIEWAISGMGATTHAVGWQQKAGSEIWTIAEPALEQHLAGVALGRMEGGAQLLIIEFAPLPNRAKHRYRLEWTARVAIWSDVRAAFPDAPEQLPPGDFRMTRAVRHAYDAVTSGQ
ncbi:MAG: hypothetical protein Q8M02_03930 [Candidatus Didemnitutus sp.]|nr:hypothetical protein [Candidatus Didemnitutus sp.]